MIRVYVLANTYPGDNLDIAVLNVGDHGDTRYILRQRIEGEGDRQYVSTTWERLEDPSLSAPPPSFRLPYAAAQALLAALTTHFQGGVDDLGMLRKDYNAERERVDKLIDVVSTIARSASAS